MNTQWVIFLVDGRRNYIKEIVKEVRPEHIYLVATSSDNVETAVDIGRTIKENISNIDIKYRIIEEPTTIKNLNALYKLLIDLKAHGFVESQIGVGLTGQKELTIAMLGIFAGLFGLTLYYYIPPRHECECGQVLVFADPNDISGFIEFRDAIASFNSYNYTRAIELFTNLFNKATSIRSKRIMEILSLLAEAYLKWDSFHYTEAWRKINRCITRIEECSIEFGEEGKELWQHLQDNLRFLDAIKEKGKIHLFKTVDLWLNGLRRYYEKKCDDAVIRFYRALEICTQYRLTSKYKIDPSNFSKTCCNIPRKKLDEFLGKIKMNTPPENIGLYHSVVLLRVLGDSFAMKIPEKVMFKLMSSRNSCILAHGFNVTTDQTVLEFANEIEAILKILFKLENVEYEYVKKQATFVSLDRDVLSRLIFG